MQSLRFHSLGSCLNRPVAPIAVPRRLSRTAARAQTPDKDPMKGAADAIIGNAVSDMTKKLIESDPAVAEQMEKVQAAMARVDRAKAAAEEFDAEYNEQLRMAGKSEEQQKAEMEQKAKQLMADAEVAAAAKMVEAAELKFMIAQAELSNVSKDVGRVESGKAAACSVVGGVFGALPLLSATSASGSDLSIALSFLAALASCALFGVTYRYAVGRDTSNANLKGGVVAGFALVRAAAAADVLQISSVDGPFTTDVIVAASIYAGQSVLLFGFAAAAIEAAFARGLITRCDDAPSRN